MTEEEKNSEAVQEPLPLSEAQEAPIEAAPVSTPLVQEAAKEEDRIVTEEAPEAAMSDGEAESTEEISGAGEATESVEAKDVAANIEPIEIIDVPAAINEEITESESEAGSQAEPAKDENKNSAKEANDKIKSSTVIGIAAIFIVIIAVIYLAAKQVSAPSVTDNNQAVKVSDQQEVGKVSIIEEATADDIGVLVNSGRTVWAKTDVFAFLGNGEKNPDANDCTQVYAVKRSVDKKYDSNMMNTVSGLLQPITTAEKEAGYFSAIPSGTILKYLKLDDTGVIEANFSGAIKNAAGSCAVTAIRSQIKSTLMQFSAVKSVIICVDGECDDSKILQP